MYQRRVPPNEIVTHDFARQLTEVSHEIGRQVGVLVNRKGYVEHVMVGDAAQIVLPVLDRSRLGQARFNGLRCLHTHVRGEKGLTRDDLNDLAILRLDLMAAIDVDEQSGLPKLMHAAYLLPATANGTEERREEDGVDEPEIFRFLDERPPGQLDVDFLELITALEAEMARNRGARKASDTRDRAL